MAELLRELIVTIVTAACAGGAVAGVVMPLMPPAWRRPSVAWGILFASLFAVAGYRHLRRSAR